MNRAKMFMKIFVFNKRLNRERFEINKKKYQMIRVNHCYSFPSPNNNKEPQNWKLFIIASLALYYLNKCK